MSNLKKLLAVIVTVCILATMTVPAFAAASEAEICAALGILKGDSSAGVTDEYLAKDTQRFQAAILYLRLIGKEEEAKAFTGEENFDDAAEIYAGGQRILAYLKANPDLGWIGIGGNKFDPTSTITAQMIYKVLLEALGYKQDVDFIYAEVLEKAAEVGLSKIADVEGLTNADMAVAIVEALTLKMKDSDKTLIEKLIEDGLVDEETAAEYGLVELVPPTLEVVSVSADNLKEVVVVFNQPVDGDTVNKDNVKVDGKDGSVSLNDDKVTAVITIDGVLDNQADYKAVISGVKSAAGVEIEKTEVSFKAFDATLPVAEKITVTGPRNFTITFSEPMDVKGTIDVKSGTSVIGVNNNRVSINGRNVDVELYSAMTDGKTYDITVKDFVDFAGYKNVIKTFELTYVKDNSAPTATVEKADQRYVVVKFNKPVSGLTVNHFWHTFTAWAPIGIYSDEGMSTEVTTSASVDKVWVLFSSETGEQANDRPIHEGTTTFGIRGKDNSNNEIKDNWGNKFESAEFTITVTADRTAPEVVELSVAAENQLKLVFSEPVKFDVDDNMEVLNEEGKSIDGVNLSIVENKDTADKEFKIGLGKNLAGETIVVRIKDVTDKALQANKMSTYTATLTITDVTGPVVDKITYKTEGEGDSQTATLYVFFNENVDGTGTSKASYATTDTNGKLTTLSKDPAFFDGNKVVKIELTAAEWAAVQARGLIIMKVKDVLGNESAGQTYAYGNMEDYEADKPEVAAIEVVASNKVVVKFDQYLRRVDSDAFTLMGTTPASMELSEEDGKTVVTLYVNTDEADEILPDASNLTLNINASGNKIENIFEVGPVTKAFTSDDSEVVKDKIAPAIAKTGDDYNITITASSDTIEIEFNEDIEDAALSNKVFEVKVGNTTYTVESVTSSDSETVTITLSSNLPASGKVSITQKLPVYDMSGNEFKLDKTIEVDIQ